MQSQPLEPQRNHAYKQPATPPATERIQVVVADIKMPFMSMVVFMVKWVIASIPAFIILVIIGALGSAIIMLIKATLIQLSLSGR